MFFSGHIICRHLQGRGESKGGALIGKEVVSTEKAEDFGNTEAIGQLLFTKYLFPFELASLLLLAAIIGAVVLAHDPRRPLKPGRGLEAKQTPKEG
jgi:NADH-quinone oxidoreductase subunit J